MQLAHPKVAQPKLGAYSAPSLLLISSTHPARMPDGPAKRPGACQVFVAASHQTRLDTRSKARRPIKVGIKGRGRSGTSRDSNPACLCCSSAHLVQCEPDEASSFTNPNVGPGTNASLQLKLDAWSSAVQGGQGDKNAARPPEGSLVETRCLIKGPKSAIVPFPGPRSGPKSRTGPGRYLSLPPTRHDLTQGQKPEGRLKWG